jgi:hypothetical protein
MVGQSERDPITIATFALIGHRLPSSILLALAAHSQGPAQLADAAGPEKEKAGL